MAHRHKAAGKWTTTDPDVPLEVRVTKLEADVKTLLAAAGGGGGTTPVPNPPPLPTTGPAITNLAITGITTTGATVSWSVSPDANGQVEYGLTTLYGSTTTLEASLLPAHSQTLSGLTPNTTYHVRVRSQSATGPVSVSSDRSFTTAQTTPVPTPPPSALIYGPGVGYETKANERLDGNKQSFRFRATGGTVTQVAVNVRTGSGYSLGTGGTVKASLQTDSAGNPSGTILGSVTWAPGNPGAAENKDQHAFSASLVAGTLYHLVLENTDGSPTSNYVSINQVLAWNPADTPRQPAFSDDFAVLRRTGGWALQNGYIPVFDLEYAGGAHDGSMYFAVILGSYALIGGTSNMARARWTVSGGTRTVDNAYIQVRRQSGSGALVVRLEQGDGTLIESVSVAASSIAIVAEGSELNHVEWTTVPFTATRTLTNGATYNLRLSCAAGTQYSIMPLRWHDSDMSAWDSYHFRDGAGDANGSSAQKSTDGGSSWDDLYAFDSVDFGWYLR